MTQLYHPWTFIQRILYPTTEIPLHPYPLLLCSQQPENGNALLSINIGVDNKNMVEMCNEILLRYKEQLNTLRAKMVNAITQREA